MLSIIIGERDGKMWKFHWDGKAMTPFSEEEMERERSAYIEERERLAAEIFNRAFVSDLPKSGQK